MKNLGNDPRDHEIHALSGAYAVDALDPDERARFEEHLDACPTCRAEVASLREATAILAEATPADPPPALRDRLLADIRTVRPLPPRVTTPARPVRRRVVALAAAAALLGVAGTGTVVWQQTHHQATSVRDRVLQAADAQRITVDLPRGATVSVVRSVSEGRAVLITRDLPAPPSGRVYELWLQDSAGTMVPAGLMEQAGDRTFVLDGDAGQAHAAGITVEPAGGSTAPTSAPIALFDFTKAT